MRSAGSLSPERGVLVSLAGGVDFAEVRGHV